MQHYDASEFDELRGDAYGTEGAPRGVDGPELRWNCTSARGILSRYGIASRIVWAVPEDAFAEGWSTQDDASEDADRAADLDAEIGTESIITTGCGSARADGWSWGWVQVEGDNDYRSPLKPGPHTIVAIHVLSRDEVKPASWQTRPEQRRWTEADVYNVTPLRATLEIPAATVHASRMIYFPGMRLTPSQQRFVEPDGGRTGSALALYVDAIADLEEAWRSTSIGLSRRGMPVLNMGQTEGVKAGDTRDGLLARMASIARAMRSRGMIVLGLETVEKLSWAAPSLSGTSEALGALAWRVAAPEGIPLSRLFGTPPTGLSTDDEAGRASYDACLTRWQRAYTACLLRIYEIAFGPAKSRRIIWAPLGQPGALEQSQISANRAQRDWTLIQAGVITPEESRRRFGDEVEAVSPVVEDTPAPLMLTGEDPTEPVPFADPTAAAPVEDIQAAALNGTQITSLRETLAAVTAKQMSPDVAEEILVSAFPTLPVDRIRRMVTLSAAFQPTVTDPTARADAAELWALVARFEAAVKRIESSGAPA